MKAKMLLSLILFVGCGTGGAITGALDTFFLFGAFMMVWFIYLEIVEHNSTTYNKE